jgi:hypothetical protein
MLNNPTGVAVPAGQRREIERAEPGKVLSVIPLEALGVRYTREDGRVLREVWYRAGDTFYVPPQAEEFATALKEVKEKYAKQIRAQLASQQVASAGVPVEDTVDVVSVNTVEDMSSNE